MKRKYMVMALPLMMLLAASCKEEKKPDNIIVKKTPVAVKKSVQSMGDNAAERDVEWLGATYHIRIERKADKSLSLAKDGQGNKYYDNRVSLLITRPDGSEFVMGTTVVRAEFADEHPAAVADFLKRHLASSIVRDFEYLRLVGFGDRKSVV